LKASKDLQTRRQFCELLIKFKADVNVPSLLLKSIEREDLELLKMFVISGVNLEEQGMAALVQSAEFGDVISAAFLLDSGVDINTPGLKMNPLATAAGEGDLEMVEFLLTRGADLNAPAYPDGGLTALQLALRSDFVLANLLLDKGADIFAPPALVGGVTALEAVSHAWDFKDEGCIALMNRLLNAGAMGNVFRGTGFQYAIALAEENGHSAVANLLKKTGKNRGMGVQKDIFGNE
jgi:ankyrin repeat protein